MRLAGLSKGDRVVVAMSGGVDSSATAGLLAYSPGLALPACLRARSARIAVAEIGFSR